MATDVASGRATQKKNREDSPLVLSLSETARMLGISAWHAGELARAGKIPSIKLGRRRVFPREGILHLLSAGTPKETAAK